MYELGEDEITLDKKKKHNVDVVVDRLIIKEGIRARLTESVETAMKYANNPSYNRCTGTRRKNLFSKLRMYGLWY